MSRPEKIIEVGKRLCPHCKVLLPLEDFVKDKRKLHGRDYICKPCQRIKSRNSHRRNGKKKSRKEQRIYLRAWREKNREKELVYNRSDYRKHCEARREYLKRRPKDQRFYARKEFASAVKAGKIVRPEFCSKCGRRGKIHGHHADYSKPLDVAWLCSLCHGKEHRIKDE